MSNGMTPYDFVQQVYYVQEKVILDFHPDDDKYKEVIMEANLVLQELQNAEDWHWLRDRVVLGTTTASADHQPLEFDIPANVYKPATMHGDCVQLQRPWHGVPMDCDAINVPLVSQGRLHTHNMRSVQGLAVVQPEFPLGAAIVGDKIKFNRELYPYELDRLVTMDVIRRMKPLHICNDSCTKVNGKCTKIESKIFTEIPDPNYMVYRTAALHAEGSPVASGRLAGLQDVSTKILSAMRENNYVTTDPDYIEYERSRYVSVI